MSQKSSFASRVWLQNGVNPRPLEKKWIKRFFDSCDSATDSSIQVRFFAIFNSPYLFILFSKCTILNRTIQIANRTILITEVVINLRLYLVRYMIEWFWVKYPLEFYIPFLLFDSTHVNVNDHSTKIGITYSMIQAKKIRNKQFHCIRGTQPPNTKWDTYLTWGAVYTWDPPQVRGMRPILCLVVVFLDLLIT